MPVTLTTVVVVAATAGQGGQATLTTTVALAQRLVGRVDGRADLIGSARYRR